MQPVDKRNERITKPSPYSTNISPSGLKRGDQNSKSKACYNVNQQSKPQELKKNPKGVVSDSTSSLYDPSPNPKAPANSEMQANPTGVTNPRTNDTWTGANTRGVCSDSLENSTAPLKPHTGGDVRWDAINAVSKGSSLDLSHFRLLKRLGYGDIGSVYLVELRGTKAYFAMKVMDKASLASRNKLLRAQTEREILGLLDHPFLPTLYTYFDTDKFYCLVMEFCSGGNLHSLRQKQPSKHFTEEAARLVLFYLFHLIVFFIQSFHQVRFFQKCPSRLDKFLVSNFLGRWLIGGF